MINTHGEKSPSFPNPELSQSDQQSPKVDEAAIWLADLPEPPAPLVPAIKERFNLSATDACRAIALAAKFRTFRRAFG